MFMKQIFGLIGRQCIFVQPSKTRLHKAAKVHCPRYDLINYFQNISIFIRQCQTMMTAFSPALLLLGRLLLNDSRIRNDDVERAIKKGTIRSSNCESYRAIL